MLKRTIDIVGSMALIGMSGPLCVGIAIGVLLTMGRPVLFVQRRPGLRGEIFRITKFRTMRVPQEGEDTIGSDPDRIVPFGRLLRVTSLDELPTLFNVLRGEMSLVGPRPLLVRYLQRYSAEQARRHDVKPGITGWAQVNGRNTLSWEDKFALDIWYVENQSLLLDLKILTKTVSKVFTCDGISNERTATMPEFMGNEGESSHGV